MTLVHEFSKYPFVKYMVQSSALHFRLVKHNVKLTLSQPKTNVHVTAAKFCTMILFIAQNGKSTAEFRHKFTASGNTVMLFKHFGIPSENYFKLKAIFLSVFFICISFLFLTFYFSSYISRHVCCFICDFTYILISSFGVPIFFILSLFLDVILRTVWSETIPALNCATIGVDLQHTYPCF
jgi:hypothetical protein